MRKQIERDGFAVAEVLLLVLILAFVAAILLPMLARVRVIPNRLTCGTKLSGIGKAMLVYSGDYGGEFPRAGTRDSSWAARTPNWLGQDRHEAFEIGPDGSGGQAGISASLYLLVKYVELVPAQFLCIDRNGRVEKGAREFKPGEYGIRDRRLADLWDFGPNPPLHCSYAYHMVYGSPMLTISAEPGMPVAADRNPWIDSPFAKAKDFSRFKPDALLLNGRVGETYYGNAVSHESKGQNVLFQDTHVAFERRPHCGVDSDNIYTAWDGANKVRGESPRLGTRPAGEKDSLLVNDPPAPRK
jgi:hypothetical protein